MALTVLAKLAVLIGTAPSLELGKRDANTSATVIARDRRCICDNRQQSELTSFTVDTGNMATESSVFYVVFLPSSLADQPRSFSGVATPAEAPTHGRSVRHSIYIF